MMKLLWIDPLHFHLYLNDCYTKDINIKEKENLEDYFKKLFLNLKKNYHMDMSGYYNIHVFLDDIYGMILEIEKEDIEYLSYFENQVDMRISLETENGFLYQIEDILSLPSSLFSSLELIQYKNRYYASMQENNPMVLSQLLEFATILYGDVVEKIKNYGKKITFSKSG